MKLVTAYFKIYCITLLVPERSLQSQMSEEILGSMWVILQNLKISQLSLEVYWIFLYFLHKIHIYFAIYFLDLQLFHVPSVSRMSPLEKTCHISQGGHNPAAIPGIGQAFLLGNPHNNFSINYSFIAIIHVTILRRL